MTAKISRKEVKIGDVIAIYRSTFRVDSVDRTNNRRWTFMLTSTENGQIVNVQATGATRFVIADGVLVEFCAACGAESGERCRPGCLGEAVELEETP